MTTTMVAAAKQRADWALETFGYLSPEYQRFRAAWHRDEDKLAEQQREELDRFDPVG